jgi:imidazole glycerol-phosphate synthase subunit HisF
MADKMHKGVQKPIYQFARELRNNATYAEQILWDSLKNKPLGYKFRRQHPYSVYILDFYCHRLKLVIEVDGSIHQLPEVKENDIERQRLLEEDGLKVIRFENSVIEQRAETVFKEIETIIQLLGNEQKRP